MVASFGHSQSSGAHEQDFISHLGQAGKRNKNILYIQLMSDNSHSTIIHT